jgi:hypothetical protein
LEPSPKIQSGKRLGSENNDSIVTKIDYFIDAQQVNKRREYSGLEAIQTKIKAELMMIQRPQIAAMNTHEA